MDKEKFNREKFKRDLTNTLDKTENYLDVKASLIGLICSAILLIVAVVIIIVSNVNFKSEVNRLRTEYGTEFVDNKIFMEVEILTANIVDNSTKGIIETDQGYVSTEKDYKSSVIIVYRNFEGELIPIDDMNSRNSESHDYLEYITKDYQVPSGSTVLKDNYDKIRYDSYLKELNAAVDTKQNNQVAGLVLAIVAGLATCLFGARYLVIKVHNKRVDKILSKAAAEQEPEKAKQNSKIEKSGIGADGKKLEDEAMRTADEAISSEGYIYKGINTDT